MLTKTISKNEYIFTSSMPENSSKKDWRVRQVVVSEPRAASRAELAERVRVLTEPI